MPESDSLLERLKKLLGRTVGSFGYLIFPIILAAPFLLFVYLKSTTPTPIPSYGGYSIAESEFGWGGTPFSYVTILWYAVFSSAACMGAIGTTVSLLSRGEPTKIENPRPLIATQMLGAMFATVLLFSFVGGLVQGSLFPSIEAHSYSTLFFRPQDWGKLLVWAFIAGFSERFVPSILDNLSMRAQEREE